MSATVTVIAGLQYVNASPAQRENAPSVGTANVVNTLTTALCHPDEQAVPTAAAGTAVPLGPVATPGWVSFQNVDSTNFCEVGLQVSGTFYPFAKLLPGDAPAQLYVADSVTLYYRGNTAPPDVRFLINSR